jgi:hypothetical protein
MNRSPISCSPLVFAGYRATFEEDDRSDYWTLGAGIRV